MRIKKIEISGFKSFCDKTVLHFGEPLTAIVGPNGCGKSNVVDALRWCMGEQSAKHLRGKEMQDVIFAGSDSRGPMGMAEVSLTFDNEGQVPIEYLNYSEITVTRKLFRDGTSEYLINKVPVRLRDVVDLFLGTGVGTKAYSIIEQGRIGMILSSKPEERRLLIEEAAGITKYKTKRKAAERKMEQTRQNLLRVSDVLSEIDKRLGSLRRQAQKAERYKKYKAELRDIELWSASHRWLGLRAQERVVGEAVQALSERTTQEAATLVEQEAEIEAARLAAAERERGLQSLQEQLYEVDNRVRLGESEIEFATREADDLATRGHAARGERTEIEGRAAEQEKELGAARESATRLAEVAGAIGGELECAQEVYQRVRTDLGAVQQRIDEHKQAIARAESQMARGEQAERESRRRADDLALRLGKLEAEDAQCGERLGELGGQTRGLGRRLGELRQTKLELGSQREQHAARLSLLKEQVARSEIELETLRTELHRRSSRKASLEEIQERYEGFQRGVRAIMQSEQRQGVRGLVADIVQAPAELEAAVEAVLGEKLGSIVVESHEVGLEAIDFLKQKSEGRGTFIPVNVADVVRHPAPPAPMGWNDSVPPGARPLLDLIGCDRNYDRVATYLFGDAVVVDDLRHAVDLFRGGARCTFVTREGEIIDPHGVVTGGSRDSGVGVLGQKRELRELGEIITRLEADYQEVLGRHVTTKSEITKLASAVEAVTQSTHQGEIEILAAEKDFARAEAELERLRLRREALSVERAELEGARQQAVAGGEEQRQLFAAAQQAHDEATRALLGEKQQAEQLLAGVDEAATRVTDLKVRAAQAHVEHEAAQKTSSRLEQGIAELSERRQRLEQTIAEGIERVSVLREKAEVRRGEVMRLAEQSQKVAAELGQGRQAYEQQLAALQGREGELKRLRQEHERTSEALHAQKGRAAGLSQERRHLEEAMAERYRVEVGRICGDYHLRPLVSEAEEARVKELRSLIERMGEINLMAIEECQELEQRFTFLGAQKADLESALSQLEQAIARINRSSKVRFEQTFEAINAKFQEVFPRLFRGGRAHLALTQSDDILEAGVEIVAQPPGKKLQTVELLSGGEKALTAVSLIFSIFLIKPSPFCLLDEVDAPLDEANVIRYNELVREMTDRSQFIVITHNKRTMEIADQLYGVTMEEPGISKLVSVNLSQKESKRAA